MFLLLYLFGCRGHGYAATVSLQAFYVQQPVGGEKVYVWECVFEKGGVWLWMWGDWGWLVAVVVVRRPDN